MKEDAEDFIGNIFLAVLAVFVVVFFYQHEKEKEERKKKLEKDLKFGFDADRKALSDDYSNIGKDFEKAIDKIDNIAA